MPAPSATVRVRRGSIVESVHSVHAAAVVADGRTVASAGDAEMVTFFRSAAETLQALPLVEDGVTERLDLTEKELALSCVGTWLAGSKPASIGSSATRRKRE